MGGILLLPLMRRELNWLHLVGRPHFAVKIPR
jgi:hypothetical protein